MLPNNAIDESAKRKIQGGALELEPSPIGCHESMYFLNKSKALAGAVESAPPASEPKRFRDAIRVNIKINSVNGYIGRFNSARIFINCCGELSTSSASSLPKSIVGSVNSLNSSADLRLLGFFS